MVETLRLSWIQQQAVKLFRLNLPYSASTGSLDDAQNIGWVPLTAPTRAIPAHQQDRMFQVSSYLYRANPVAFRIIELIPAFVVGDGVIIKAADPEVNTVIQAFWNDRRNKFRRFLGERVKTLSLYGEALYPAYVNPVNGAVTLGAMFPGIIKQVLPNPRNTHEVDAVVTKAGQGLKVNENGQLIEVPVPEQILHIIKQDVEVKSDTFGMDAGDAFYFSINTPMDILRGISDLYTIADWLDIFDQFLFNRAERQAALSSYLWDIKLEGMSQVEVDQWLSSQILQESKQRSGRMFAHNEKVTRAAIAPNLQADDAVNDARAFMSMIWSGTGFSSQAFGDPGQTGRAVGNDMNEWVYKTLSARQLLWRNNLLDIFDFVIDQAIIHGEIKEHKVNRYIEIFMPKISMRDLQRLTQALRNFGGFVGQAVGANNILELKPEDKDRLRSVMHNLLDHVDAPSSPDMLKDVVTGLEIPTPVHSTANGNSGR